MCREGTNELVVIDFGESVKESDKTYENHPTNSNFDGLLTYQDFKVFTDAVIAEHFLDKSNPKDIKIFNSVMKKERETFDKLKN